ncbi:MAG: hypothetical protein IPF64_06385 [Flavobacteriales bacterium]|nr:hypothetical protein [Flavobacteriales bacterium]
MHYLYHFIVILLFSVPFTAAAQESPNGEEEHRYLFTFPTNVDAATEKVFLEAVSGFDPRMHVDIDLGDETMKLLTYEAIDAEAVVELALQLGIMIETIRIELDDTQHNKYEG